MFTKLLTKILGSTAVRAESNGGGNDSIVENVRARDADGWDRSPVAVVSSKVQPAGPFPAVRRALQRIIPMHSAHDHERGIRYV